MTNRSILLRTGLRACSFFMCAVLCSAVQTRTWLQSDYSEFEKGNIKKLSVRSDGRLTLAPASRELLDSSSAYLWALAQDSKGNLYTGGGPEAKLYQISGNGTHKVAAEFAELEIHAIAVDRKDRVYVGTAPDGKVYRFAGSGKPEVFYDPKAKYIWALAFNNKGDLFVATGDQGEIHRVSPDGKGSVFFKSEEAHARSLAIDAADNLIVGTEPGGLVLRLSPSGQGFVVYQMPKREVTAVAAARDGSIYAAGVGNKQGPAITAPPLPPAPAPPAPGAAAAPGAPTQQRPAALPPPSFSSSGAISVPGGSEVYRIDATGYPQRVWNHSQDIIYAIAFDAAGKVLLGSGNKGTIYRVDSSVLYTSLVNTPPTQVTMLVSGQGGKIYAATGNVGKVYEIGPEIEREGSIESDVFDAGLYSLWGRLGFHGNMNGAQVSVVTRSGNLDQPQKNWSPWADPITSAQGGRITSPPARFLQWRATLTQGSGGRSPELDGVELAYLPKNGAPRIEEIDITPANYKFPAPPPALTPGSTLNLPPMGKRTKATLPAPADTSTPAMQAAKGFTGARWTAADENGDAMIYSIEIRGSGEQQWKLLKDKIRERYYSWDSTAFPDGEYQIRVTASDLPSNPPAAALTGALESDHFLIDNTPPRITGLTAARQGGAVVVRWKAIDSLSNLDKAEYSLDGGDWLVAPPVGQLSDSSQLDYELKIDGVAPGEHTIAVRVQDEYDNQSTEKAVVRQ
jgi:hypothetical protein